MNNFNYFSPKNYNIAIAIEATQIMSPIFSILRDKINEIFTQVNELRNIMKIKYTASIGLIAYKNYDSLEKTIIETPIYY
jgi:hypothetical protein